MQFLLSPVIVLIVTLYFSPVVPQNVSTVTNLTSTSTVSTISTRPAALPQANATAATNSESNDVQNDDSKVEVTTVLPEAPPTRASTTKTSTTHPPLVRGAETTLKPTISNNMKSNPSEQKENKSGASRVSAGFLVSSVILLGLNNILI